MGVERRSWKDSLEKDLASALYEELIKAEIKKGKPLRYDDEGIETVKECLIKACEETGVSLD